MSLIQRFNGLGALFSQPTTLHAVSEQLVDALKAVDLCPAEECLQALAASDLVASSHKVVHQVVLKFPSHHNSIAMQKSLTVLKQAALLLGMIMDACMEQAETASPPMLQPDACMVLLDCLSARNPPHALLLHVVALWCNDEASGEAVQAAGACSTPASWSATLRECLHACLCLTQSQLRLLGMGHPAKCGQDSGVSAVQLLLREAGCDGGAQLHDLVEPLFILCLHACDRLRSGAAPWSYARNLAICAQTNDCLRQLLPLLWHRCLTAVVRNAAPDRVDFLMLAAARVAARRRTKGSCDCSIDPVFVPLEDVCSAFIALVEGVAAVASSVGREGADGAGRGAEEAAAATVALAASVYGCLLQCHETYVSFPPRCRALLSSHVSAGCAAVVRGLNHACNSLPLPQGGSAPEDDGSGDRGDIAHGRCVSALASAVELFQAAAVSRRDASGAAAAALQLTVLLLESVAANREPLKALHELRVERMAQATATGLQGLGLMARIRRAEEEEARARRYREQVAVRAARGVRVLRLHDVWARTTLDVLGRVGEMSEGEEQGADGQGGAGSSQGEEEGGGGEYETSEQAIAARACGHLAEAVAPLMQGSGALLTLLRDPTHRGAAGSCSDSGSEGAVGGGSDGAVGGGSDGGDAHGLRQCRADIRMHHTSLVALSVDLLCHLSRHVSRRHPGPWLRAYLDAGSRLFPAVLKASDSALRSSAARVRALQEEHEEWEIARLLRAYGSDDKSDGAQGRDIRGPRRASADGGSSSDSDGSCSNGSIGGGTECERQAASIAGEALADARLLAWFLHFQQLSLDLEREGRLEPDMAARCRRARGGPAVRDAVAVSARTVLLLRKLGLAFEGTVEAVLLSELERVADLLRCSVYLHSLPCGGCPDGDTDGDGDGSTRPGDPPTEAATRVLRAGLEAGQELSRGDSAVDLLLLLLRGCKDSGDNSSGSGTSGVLAAAAACLLPPLLRNSFTALAAASRVLLRGAAGDDGAPRAAPCGAQPCLGCLAPHEVLDKLYWSTVTASAATCDMARAAAALQSALRARDMPADVSGEGASAAALAAAWSRQQELRELRSEMVGACKRCMAACTQLHEAVHDTASKHGCGAGAGKEGREGNKGGKAAAKDRLSFLRLCVRLARGDV